MAEFTYPTGLRMAELVDKVVVVTGATGLIGKEVALECARHRALLVLAEMAEKMPALWQVFKDLGDNGSAACVLPFDLGDKVSCDNLIARALSRFGRIDALVNVASDWSNKPFWSDQGAERSSWEEIDRVARANVTGTMCLSRRAAEAMIKNQPAPESGLRGSIIQITSIHDFRCTRGWHIEYAVTKAAQRRLVEELAVQIGHHGIRVNGIAPGAIRETAGPYTYVPLRQQTGTPLHIARAVVLLISDYWSSYWHGTIPEVSGGLHLYSHMVDEKPPGTV